MQGHAVRIGGNDNKKGEWRCKVCKFMNSDEVDKCGMCREDKQVMKDPPKIKGP